MVYIRRGFYSFWKVGGAKKKKSYRIVIKKRWAEHHLSIDLSGRKKWNKINCAWKKKEKRGPLLLSTSKAELSRRAFSSQVLVVVPDGNVWWNKKRSERAREREKGGIKVCECVSYRDERVHGMRWSSETRREAITRARQVLRQTAAAESQWPGRQRMPAPPLLLLLLKTGTGSRRWPPLGKKVDDDCSKLFWWAVVLLSSQSPGKGGWTGVCWGSSTIILGWGWTTTTGDCVVGAAVGGGDAAARFFDSGESLVP